MIPFSGRRTTTSSNLIGNCVLATAALLCVDCSLAVGQTAGVAAPPVNAQAVPTSTNPVNPTQNTAPGAAAPVGPAGGPMNVPADVAGPGPRPIPGTIFPDRSNGAYSGRDPNAVRIGSRFDARMHNRDSYPLGDPYGRTLENPRVLGNAGTTANAAPRLFGPAAAATFFQGRVNARTTMLGVAATPNLSARTNAGLSGDPGPLGSSGGNDPGFANRDSYPPGDPYGRTIENPAFAGIGSPSNPIILGTPRNVSLSAAGTGPLGMKAAQTAGAQRTLIGRATFTKTPSAANSSAVERMQLTPENMLVTPARFQPR